ncbi:hypothetical protein GCM10025734_43150 [Kitasatospora paranensis]
MTALPAGYWTHRRTAAHQEYRAARDLLLGLRDDPAAARARFGWPRPRHFNWALEWFDVVAADCPRPALRLLGEPAADGTVPVAEDLSYAELSARSDTLAVALAGLGVARGDRVLLLLGARSELWESLLGCLKLGAVVVPTYQDVTAEEAADRIGRGRIRHVLATAGAAALVADLPVPGRRIALGEDRPAGWDAYPDTRSVHHPYLPDGPTPAGDPAFCYFTSGTTSLPKLVEHTHASYPVGHLSSLYWNGLRPGDVHLNLSAPGWAKHSWSSFFVPFAAEATVLAPPDGGCRRRCCPGCSPGRAPTPSAPRRAPGGRCCRTCTGRVRRQYGCARRRRPANR